MKSGAGTLVLNGLNTYTGDTVINAGTLRIGTNATANGASLNGGNYAGNIAIAAGATLNVQTNVSQTLSGVISGDGNIIKSYTGTLVLSGNNTYTGKTSIVPSILPVPAKELAFSAYLPLTALLADCEQLVGSSDDGSQRYD